METRRIATQNIARDWRTAIHQAHAKWEKENKKYEKIQKSIIASTNDLFNCRILIEAAPAVEEATEEEEEDD